MTPLERVRRRSRREWLAALLVLFGLLAYAALVYVVVVLAGGALLGRSSSSPDVALSVVATAVIALTFDPVQSLIDGLAARAVHGGQVSPFDVLRQFSETATGQYPAEELPSRMARVLAQGTGAEWAQVWVVVGDRMTPAASWPPGVRTDPDADPMTSGIPGRRSQVVLHGGELLGVLVVQERDNQPLTSVEERLFAGLASQSRLVLRGARLRAELERRLEQLTARAEELRRSRQRLVDAQDNGRRALERDVHDGAQQHLVALAVNIRLAQTLAPSSPYKAEQVVLGQETAAADAVETLLQLARGIYPQLLAEGGLVLALRAAVANNPVPVELNAVDVERYPPRQEAAVYFCCLEALQNAAKHARATGIGLELRGTADGSLTFCVDDNGVGFDPGAAPAGSGLTNMRDRLEALDGTLTVTSSATGGTRITGRMPAAGDQA